MKYVTGTHSGKVWALPEEDEHWGPWCESDDGFQLERLQVALPHVSRHDVAIDIGAHIGTWTYVLAQHFAQVWAFEPAEDTFACLEHNMQDVRDVVRIFPYALGSAVDQVHMEMGDRGKKRAWNTGGRYVQPGGSIELRTLDSFQLAHCDFIKIDVEGYELEVLKGAQQTLQQYRPILYVEIGKNATPTFGASRHETRAFLEALGMRCIWRMKADHLYVW